MSSIRGVGTAATETRLRVVPRDGSDALVIRAVENAVQRCAVVLDREAG